MEKPRAKDGASSRGTLKRRHLGIAGLATVLIQAWVGAKSENTVKSALQEASQAQLSQIREEIRTTKAELEASRERDFVRKTDINPALRKIEKKLEKVVDASVETQKQVTKIEAHLKAKRLFGYSGDDPWIEEKEMSSR